MEKYKPAFVITARCASERFPNKVIAELAGKPMIVQIIERCRSLGYGFPVIVATTTGPEDNKLEEIAREAGAFVTRGPGRNLLERHRMVIEEHGVTHLIRAGGDSPFFDCTIAKLYLDVLEHERPDVDCINGKPIYPPHPMEITCIAIERTSMLDICQKIFDEDPEVADLMESYAAVAQMSKYSDRCKSYLIDIAHLLPKGKTHMKTSIDYPIELWLANKIVAEYGRMPYDSFEMLEAYAGLKYV